MRLLVINSVPLNGGDEALLRATLALLRSSIPDSSVRILCKDVEACRRYMPDLELAPDLEHVPPPRTTLGRLLRKARFRLTEFLGIGTGIRTFSFFASEEERRILDYYQSADLVISSAGGFIHDYYRIRNRMNGFELALSLAKPLVIIGQSVGPFWKRGSRRRIRKVLGQFDAVFLREELSFAHLRDCDVPLARVFVTADMAFYWRAMAPHLFVQKSGPLRRIALCFREWTRDGVSVGEIVAKGARLCAHLLGKGSGIELVFLSTCQGIPEYLDDSVMARAVVAALPAQLQARCTIDGQRHGPERLIALYSAADAYVGMRLHGAILSMLGGTPAMAIAYEDKTPGIYGTLGLEDLQVDHRKSADDWISCADAFIRTLEDTRRKLPLLLDEAVQKLDLNRTVLADIARKEKVAAGLKVVVPAKADTGTGARL